MQKKKRRWPKILGITILVIVVLAAAALGGYLYLRNRFGTGTAEVHLTADVNTVVSVTGGDLTGGTEDGVYSFLGVPYATAPERFTAPEEAHWDGIPSGFCNNERAVYTADSASRKRRVQLPKRTADTKNDRNGTYSNPNITF